MTIQSFILKAHRMTNIILKFQGLDMSPTSKTGKFCHLTTQKFIIEDIEVKTCILIKSQCMFILFVLFNKEITRILC